MRKNEVIYHAIYAVSCYRQRVISSWMGHSKDHRPDLPQVKVMQAILDPLAMPLVTDVVAGGRADDPLYDFS